APPLLERYVVVERVGRIARVVVVVVDERERVGVAGDDRGGLARPCARVRAGPREHRGRGVRGVVPQGRGGPVIGDRVSADDAVPEGQARRAGAGGERLRDRGIPAERRGTTDARGVCAAVPAGARGGAAGGAPSGKRARLESAVGDARRGWRWRRWRGADRDV